MECNRNLDELTVLFASLTEGEQWESLGADEYRLKLPQGTYIDYNSAKRTLNVGGKRRLISRTLAEIKALLRGDEPGLVSAAPPTEIFVKNESIQSEYQTDLDSEIVIGVVATVGTNTDEVFRLIAERLKLFKYNAEEIKISRDILEKFVASDEGNSAERLNRLMDEGNRLRKQTEDYGILAKLATGLIYNKRFEYSGMKEPIRPFRRKCFVVNSLKHPHEVQALRKVYSNGFFLIGVHAAKDRRIAYLKNKGMLKEEAEALVDRDEHEADKSGQQTRDTFHLSDFFINYDGDADRYNNELNRVLDLIFGHPFITPTFDEFAMFMAFSASLRSADLSRQVGAVVTKNNNIVSTGANDVPRAGGGLYWAERSNDGKSIEDVENGRDYMRGFDANVIEKQRIIDDIVSKFDEPTQQRAKAILEESKLRDITEYGRVTHAEMEALLACARNAIPTLDTDLYCTTFPCHNCAKHIIAAGVKRVVYVEPYPKSKALEFHSDSITFEKNVSGDQRVVFEPFVGVGPRSFFNLFSTSLGSGFKIDRKDDHGTRLRWTEAEAKVRMQMIPSSYMDREAATSKEALKKMEDL